MSNILIGTAGHIDHGKSCLVKALTGYDSDRLPEEKRRGISIELGFAPLELPSGTTLGLVDVPGHERFIKTMMTGVSGIDAVLFLIAANEGIMPQTREHLDIINLLDIQNGIVVLSKCDLANEEQLLQLEETVKTFLKNTGLREAPLIRTSAHTGQGLPKLLDSLDLLVKNLPARSMGQGARLPLDRVFSLAGHGTIVTGTVWGGEIRKNDNLDLIFDEQKLPVRIRNLQVHGKDRECAAAGERAALNLAGIELNQVPRGAWLAEKGLLQPSYRFDLKLKALPTTKKLVSGQRVHLHHAAKETIATIRLLDREDLPGGESCYCQVLLDSPLSALAGDKVVLRFYSPAVTIAGGTILCATPPHHKRFQHDVLQLLQEKDSGDPLRQLFSLMVTASPSTAKELAQKSHLPLSQVEKQLELLLKEDLLCVLSGTHDIYYLGKDNASLYQNKAIAEISAYHKAYPLRQGIPLAELYQKIATPLPKEPFLLMMKAWNNYGLILLKADKSYLPDFQIRAGEREKSWRQSIEKIYLEKLFSPPKWSDVANTACIPIKEQKEILLWLIDDFLIKINNEIMLHKQAINKFEELIITAKGSSGFSLAEAKEILATNRKNTLLILEYMDSIKTTRRVGELRYFLNKPK